MVRRRKPKVVWLPYSTEGSAIVSSAATLIGGTLDFGGPAGAFATLTFPVVVDQPASALASEGSLADFEGSSYRLRRIVGKIWAGVEAKDFTTAPGACIFYAGFIVLRVDTNGGPLAGANNNNYHPGILESERDPWIWRRSWLLGNPGSTGTPFPTLGSFEGFNTAHSGNWEYGSVADGPHVDAKTARIISDEERLFLVIGATALGGQQEGVDMRTSVLADLRVLASMRSSSGNRRNASR